MNTNTTKIKPLFTGIPSRPMIDIQINNNISVEETIDYLIKEFSKINPYSIIRIDTKGLSNYEDINYSFLQSIAPKNSIISFRNNWANKG